MSSRSSVADATEPRDPLEENKDETGEDAVKHNRHSFAADDDDGDSRKTELHEYGDDLAPLDLVYELGHISTRRNPARPLTLSHSSQDVYYRDLVASRCRGDNLPSIYARKHYPRAAPHRSEPVGSTVLYDSIDRDEVITVDRVKRSDGVTLSMRKLRDILWTHFREQIRREYIEMLETGTTSEAQLNRVHDLLRKIHQEHEIADLVNDREHQLMTARIERQRALHPPTRAPTKQSIVSAAPVDDEERQVQVHEDKFEWLKNVMRPGPVQFLASKSLASTYDDYASEMSRNRKYGQLDFPRRLLAAIVAGGSLVAPMLIMSIHSSLRKSLVVSSCFVLAFALGAAWKSAMKPEDVLAATAAYTAVLVVFVGVNTSGATH